MEIDPDLYLKRTVVQLKCVNQFLMRTLNVIVTNLDVVLVRMNIDRVLSPVKDDSFQLHQQHYVN